MVDAELVALAALAGRTVVAAAATDGWETAKQGFVRLLGRGDAGRAAVAEQRLEETRGQLAGVSGPDLKAAGAEQARLWQVRVADLLEESPGLEAGLRSLITEVQAALAAGTVTARGHGVAANRDVSITASGGGLAAGTVHGSVSVGNPTRPGTAS